MNEPTSIQANQLTEGDVISHEGDLLKIATPPTYTQRGIEFEALSLSVGNGQTQAVCLPLNQAVSLVDHQPTFNYNQPLTA